MFVISRNGRPFLTVKFYEKTNKNEFMVKTTLLVRRCLWRKARPACRDWGPLLPGGGGPCGVAGQLAGVGQSMSAGKSMGRAHPKIIMGRLVWRAGP